jgi:tetratricopeptide (TPR) repeat protein
MLRFFCILSLFSFSATAQDLEETYHFGLEQYALSNYDVASLAFERVLYFGEGHFAISSLDHLARIQLTQGEKESAVNYYHRAAVMSDAYAEKCWFTLRKCSGMLALHKTQLALIDLYGISDDLPDSIVYYKNFLLGVAHFSNLNFEESRNAFKHALPASESVKQHQLDSLFQVLIHIRHPNPKAAKILSVILPGAGQFYAGDVKNGINSLLLTGGFLFLAVNTAVNYGIVHSMASVFPWFQRYYLGGYTRAGRIAEDRLSEKRDLIYQNILNVYD